MSTTFVGGRVTFGTVSPTLPVRSSGAQLGISADGGSEFIGGLAMGVVGTVGGGWAAPKFDTAGLLADCDTTALLELLTALEGDAVGPTGAGVVEPVAPVEPGTGGAVGIAEPDEDAAMSAEPPGTGGGAGPTQPSEFGRIAGRPAVLWAAKAGSCPAPDPSVARLPGAGGAGLMVAALGEDCLASVLSYRDLAFGSSRQLRAA